MLLFFSLSPCGEETWGGEREEAGGRTKMAGGELLVGDLSWGAQMAPEGAGCPKGSLLCLLCFLWFFPLF